MTLLEDDMVLQETRDGKILQNELSTACVTHALSLP